MNQEPPPNPPAPFLLLIQILLQTIAVFVPVRDPRSRNWSAVWMRRREFFTRGIEWTAGGAAAERKAAERSLKKLVSAGLVWVFRSGGKVSRLKLTVRGDAIARAIVGLPGTREMLAMIGELHRRKNSPSSSAAGSCDSHCDSRPWIPETSFTGGRGWGDGFHHELVGIEDRMVLAMTRQFVESNADLHGHVYYRLTPDGLAVAAGDLVPEAVPDLPDVEEWAVDHATACSAAAMASIRAKTDGERDIGAIPLPASMLDKRSARALAREAAQVSRN